MLAMLGQVGEIEQLFCHGAAALRIAASTTIGNYILPEMIGRYWKGFLDSQLELNVSNSQDVIAAVTDLRVDLGR